MLHSTNIHISLWGKCYKTIMWMYERREREAQYFMVQMAWQRVAMSLIKYAHSSQTEPTSAWCQAQIVPWDPPKHAASTAFCCINSILRLLFTHCDADAFGCFWKAVKCLIWGRRSVWDLIFRSFSEVCLVPDLSWELGMSGEVPGENQTVVLWTVARSPSGV